MPQPPSTRSAPSCTCCATVRCTTRTGSSTAGWRATTCPRSAGGWPTSPPSTSPTTTSPTWSPARWSAPRRRPRRSPTRTTSRSPSTTGSSRPATTSRACPSRGGVGLLKHPRLYPKMLNPFRPSWGEPYVEIVERMRRAIVDARAAARGHEAVIVSHQAPIWMIRLATEGQPLWHNPRQPRVLAGVAHLAHLPRRRAALAELQRAGRVAARPGPARGGRMTVRPTARWAVRLSRPRRSSSAPPGARRTRTRSRRRPRPATRRATSPATVPSRPSPRTNAGSRSSSRAPCSTARRGTPPRPAARCSCSTCGARGARPCVAEAPALQKTWSELQADKAPVEFVGIDFREDPARGAAFARKAGHHLPEPERRVRGRHPGAAGQGADHADHPGARHRGPDRRPGQRRRPRPAPCAASSTTSSPSS